MNLQSNHRSTLIHIKNNQIHPSREFCALIDRISSSLRLELSDCRCALMADCDIVVRFNLERVR